MAYPGRQNIYEATIRRMVTQAIEQQELQFRQEHGGEPDEMLLDCLREWAMVNGHTPWPGEMTGGSLLLERFGSWDRATGLAGLPPPQMPNRPQGFRRIQAETELQKEAYRRRKAEKKQLAQKRRAQQAARRAEQK